MKFFGLVSFRAANSNRVCFGKLPKNLLPIAHMLVGRESNATKWGRSGVEPKVFKFRFKPHCVLNAGAF